MSPARSRLIIPVLAALAVAVLAGLYAWRMGRPASPEPQPAATAVAPPRTALEPAAPPVVAPGAGSPGATASAPAPVPPGDARTSPGTPDVAAPAAPVPPSFDVVRIEKSGETVIAGRAAPGSAIALLLDGQPHARAVTDPSGFFALVPPDLSPGTHELTLQTVAPDGSRLLSAQSVTVVIAPGRDRVPLVTVTAPDAPTVVLSRPDTVAAAPAGQAPAAAAPLSGSPAPAAVTAGGAPGRRAEVRIATVESESSGRMLVSGQGAPGATVRLYLNDTFLAPATADAFGHVTFSIERGVTPGEYRVRIDDVDPVTGSVKSRAEVPFSVAPTDLGVSAAGRPATPAARSQTVARAPDAPAANGAPGSPAGGTPAGTGTRPAPDGSPSAGTAARPGALAAPLPTSRVPPPASGASGSPTPGVVAGTAAPGGAPGARGPDGGRRLATRAAPGTVPNAATPPGPRAGAVVIPELSTATVTRGENLWRISKRIYGRGTRYSVIYGANAPQIRDPDLIYPGQVFVLPAR